jgi:hypothetical protein
MQNILVIKILPVVSNPLLVVNSDSELLLLPCSTYKKNLETSMKHKRNVNVTIVGEDNDIQEMMMVSISKILSYASNMHSNNGKLDKYFREKNEIS